MKVFRLFSFLSTIVFATTVSAETLTVDLDKAIEIAIAENPTISIADKDIQLKEIANTEAWQNLLPTVSATGSLQHTLLAAEMKLGDQKFKMGKDNTNTAALAGTLTLPLFMPAVYQSMKLTKQDVLLAREKARSSRLDLVNQVTKAYYQLLIAQESQKVMEKAYSVSKENYELVNKKYTVGKVSEYDKISAEVQMRSMSTSLVQAKNAVTLSQLNLKVLMGVTADVDVVINDNLESYKSSLTLDNVENGVFELSNNTTMRQIDLNQKLLERNISIQRTNFMPSLAFQLTGQYQSLYNENWKIWKYDWAPSSTFTLALTIPIFTASNWTKIKSSKVQLAQLQDTRTNTMRQLNMALESYKENMVAAISEVESNAEAVNQADKARTIAEKRYDVGKGTILELNQSELALTQAQLTYYQSIYNYLTNKADFDYTLGRKF
ncbi:MAG: TolC family protein [Prevotellaceae bacterium]|nr:TolC family protein [Prevotellaceae bacterium]